LSNVLINSFPKALGSFSIYSNDKQSFEEIPKGFSGFAFSKMEYDAALDNSLKQLFLGLLMHDKVILRYDDFVRCIELLGSRNIMTLMKEDALTVLYDLRDFAFLEKDGGLKLSVLGKLKPIRDIFDGYTNIKCQSSKEQSKLRQLVDSKKILIDQDAEYSDEEKIISEITRDFNSKELRTALGVVDNTPNLVEKSIKLRVCEVAQGFVLQSKCNAESIIQDSISESYLRQKIILNSNSVTKTEGFEYLLQKKGIPDLFYLFKRNILSVDDVIKIRDSGQASIFRKWLKSNDFDKEKLVSAVLKKKTKSIKASAVRFLYPTIIGLFNAPLGITASAIDSFFIPKLLDNWSPEVYLDEKIASFIEKKQKKHIELRQLELFKKHGLKEPFDDCYCGSGRSFSKCHGEI
tara:strand:+ start:1678 stop:2895 length:1218 start_codon:yes stop_codon:yes gene_type:complete